MPKFLRRALVAVAAATAIITVLAGGPAAAHGAAGSWSDNHQICKFSTGCLRSGNLVRMWQYILWADERFTDLTEIDGSFGGRTHNWTVQWQSRHMSNDTSGKVGQNTWTAAQKRVEKAGTCSSDGWRYAEYHGTGNRVAFLREHCSTLAWQLENPRTGQWIDTSH